MQTKPLKLKYRTTILLTYSQRKRLEKLAADTGVLLSEIVRRAIESALTAAETEAR